LCIREELTAIESQLETTKKEIQSRLKALDRLQVGEGTSVVKQDTTSTSSESELRRMNSVIQKLAACKTQKQILAIYLGEHKLCGQGAFSFRKKMRSIVPRRARLR